MVLYAGTRRLDPGAAILGVPPLVDGAVLALHAPADHGHEEAAHPGPLDPAGGARLHVIGGPDAGGVHLLQGGQVRIGRSADADVPLDDPDVSRLHCAVTVDPAGRQVSVADLGSTNGTRVDGGPVGPRPVPLPPGALLRIGESTLRLEAPAPAGGAAASLLPVVPDAEGHLRVTLAYDQHAPRPPYGSGRDERSWPADRLPAPRGPEGDGYGAGPGALRQAGGRPSAAPDPADGVADPYRAGPADHSRAAAHDLPTAAGREAAGRDAVTLAGHGGVLGDPAARGAGPVTGLPGTIGAWARRIAGGRPGGGARGGRDEGERLAAEAAALRDRAPDPATVLVTALGPGARLWERGTDHPDALTVRLGTADLPTGDGPCRRCRSPWTCARRAHWAWPDPGSG